MSKYQEVRDEMANKFIDACGDTGVLNAVDNDSLTGDVKIRHAAAKKACKSDNPHVQAIFARIYGLI